MSGGRSSWRPVGKNGDPYPAWLRALEQSSGVYAIRVPGVFSPTVVYVGESHSGRLLKTVTRHFQYWSRGKGWWDGMFAPSSDADPGRTCPRGDCEVAIQPCPASQAIALQYKWIKSLAPRDNIIGADEEEVPF